MKTKYFKDKLSSYPLINECFDSEKNTHFCMCMDKLKVKHIHMYVCVCFAYMCFGLRYRGGKVSDLVLINEALKRKSKKYSNSGTLHFISVL